MPVSVQDGRAVTVVLNPPVSQSDTIRHRRYPQAVVPRAWKRALATVMNNAG